MGTGGGWAAARYGRAPPGPQSGCLGGFDRYILALPAAGGGGGIDPQREGEKMAHELPALPFDEGALAPHISAETLQFHYGKHHAAYVTNLNKLIPNTEFADLPLVEIVKRAKGGISRTILYI